MKEILWTVLVTSVILQCFGEADAYSVYLDPSPTAKVKEGNALILNCSCSGSNNPDFINWYLDNDTLGLVIEASSCKYQTRPRRYEIDRYNISCHETKFYLSIANISKDKDDQDTWKCDTTVIGMHPPLKASTRIEVIGAGRPDTKSGHHDKPNTVVEVKVVVVGVIAVITAFAVITVAGCLVCRKLEMNKINKDHDEDHYEDHDEDHVEDHVEKHEQMGKCLEIRILKQIDCNQA